MPSSYLQCPNLFRDSGEMLGSRVFGRDLNIAARLAPGAARVQTLASMTSCREAGLEASFEAVFEVNLKGVGGSIQFVSLGGSVSAENDSGGPVGFVETGGGPSREP